MKVSKKVTAVALAIMLMFSLCGCDLFGILYPNEDTEKFEQAFSADSNYREKIVSFSEMEYRRPDVNAMQTLADDIIGKVKKGAGRNEVTAKLDEFYELYYDFFTMEELAGIRSDIDVTDGFYFDEYSYCSSQEATVSRMMNDMQCACANSDMSAYLDSQYFDGYLAEHFSADGDFSYTDKLVDIYNKESSLLADYREVLADMVSYNGSDVYGQYNEPACKIFIELIKTRKELAEELGFDSYEDYMFYSYDRDYTVSELDDYLAAIKEYIVPLYKKAYNKGIMNDIYYGLDAMNTDAAVSCFDSFASKMPEQIKAAYEFMKNYGLYYISCDKNASDISYTTYLSKYDAPFMLVKSDGYAEDMLTIVHEFGHFCDNYINSDGDDSLDTTELMSQSLEYMLLCYLDDSSLASSLTRYKMIDELYLYVTQAGFYDFEHRVYQLSADELTVDNINKLFAEVADEYGFSAGSSSLLSWIDINHIFDYPFYVISYCISDSAAFSLYNMELNSKGSGLEMYVKLLNNAAKYNFEKLLDKEGMSSPISRDTVKGVSQMLSERLGL